LSSPGHAARMEARNGRMLATGGLLLAGALGHREKAGLRITLKDGSYTVAEGPAGESVLMSAGGMSVSEAPSKDAFVAMIKEFLAIAGDGTCECLGYAFPVMKSERDAMGGVIPSFMVDGAA